MRRIGIEPPAREANMSEAKVYGAAREARYQRAVLRERVRGTPWQRGAFRPHR